MKRVGIVATRKEEVLSLLDSLENVMESEESGHRFYTGCIGGKELAIGISDVGKVNAAIVSEVLFLKYAVDSIISIGTAGSLTPRIRVFDMVISESITYHDVDRLQMNTYWPYCEYFYSDKGLIKAAIEAYRQIDTDYNIYYGRCITGDRFIDNDELKFIIENEYKADCVDMEAAAAAHVSYSNRVPFLAIRSICNNADDNASMLHSEIDAKCEKNISKFILALIQVLTAQ